MKAAFLTGLRKFEVSEVPTPVPSEEEVLVELKSVGICGSDVHYYTHGKIGKQFCKYPQIIGHEPSGTVEEPGKSVKRLKKGDRVIIEPQLPCGECHWCRQGKHNICPSVRFLGTPPIDGAYSEYIVMPEKNLILLPDELSYEEGALTEPLAVALHAVKLAGDLKGKNIGIFGSGTIGLSIMIAARIYGAKMIICTDVLDYRLEFAKKIGADHTVNPKKENVYEFIREKTKGLLLDVVFEAAGNCDAINDSARATTYGGICIVSGIPAEDSVSLEIHEMRKKEFNLKVLRRSHNNVREAIELIKRKKIDMLSIVTHRFGLAEISKAFETAREYRDNVIKTMINI